jgi:hypothetical protein
MVASIISLPTVAITSLGGMQPNIAGFSQSGVPVGWEKSSGVGRSTLMPRFLMKSAKASNWALAASTVSWGLRAPLAPHVAVDGDLASNRRLLRRDHAPVGRSDDDVLEGIPLVPGVDDCLSAGAMPDIDASVMAATMSDSHPMGRVRLGKPRRSFSSMGGMNLHRPRARTDFSRSRRLA